MKLLPHHLAIIRAVALSGACAIRASGQECQPTLLLFNSTPDGELGAMAGPLPLAMMDKDAQAAEQQLRAREPGTAAAVLIQEAWEVLRPFGVDLDTIVGHVAEQPDSAEVLIVSAMSDCEQYLLVAKINGRTIAPADFERVDTGAHIGRFIRQAPPA